MMQAERDVDLMGYKRGAHKDGADVCEHFVVQTKAVPGVWGWNDTNFLNCAACGRPAVDHVVLREPEAPDPTPERVRGPVRRDAPPPQSSAASGLSSDQIAAFREAQAQMAAATKVDLEMLDESVDPLAVAAQIRQAPKPAPSPPAPSPPAAPAELPAELMAALLERAEAESKRFAPAGAPPAEPDAAVASLLAREKAYSEAFKDEVEQMVRESIAAERRKTLDAEIDRRMEGDKPSARCRYGSAAELLDTVGLAQYKGAFEKEAMDPETLVEVMAAQGRHALEEVRPAPRAPRAQSRRDSWRRQRVTTLTRGRCSRSSVWRRWATG